MEKHIDAPGGDFRAAVHLPAPARVALQDLVNSSLRQLAGGVNAAAIRQNDFVAPAAGGLQPFQGGRQAVRLVEGGDDHRVFLHFSHPGRGRLAPVAIISTTLRPRVGFSSEFSFLSPAKTG